MTSNFSNQKNRKIKTQYKHLLRLESLEERALLSAVPLSASEYADLRAQYADFNLPENMEDMNVITLDLAEGDGLTALQDAITTAGTTEKSDLIVVRTSETANTLTYTSDENELYIEIDANDFGSVTIVGWGVQNLMLDVDLQSNCGIEVFGETTIAKLGGLTITNAYNGISSFESDEVMVTHCNILSSDINGIASVYGTLTVTNSTISNTTEGGIYKSEGTLTVTDCTISGNASHSGGGIWCYNADATVTDCLISNNSAIDSGGGIFFGGDYSSTITNCSIWGNSAREGGGIYIDRYTESEGSVTITDCTISDNVADSYGGGIYNFVDGVTITDCTISDNVADFYGKGIYNIGYGVTITDCTISDNVVDYGGGIYNIGYGVTITDCTISGNDGTGIENDGTLTITDCTISGNDGTGIVNYRTLTITDCTISGNDGTGILNYGTLTITNSLISGNSGGGIFNEPYYNDASAVITLTNCTIAGNTSEYEANGFYNDYLAEASVYNSIIIDSIVNDYGTISGSNNLSSFTNWDSSSNNIRYNSTKPLFVDAENGDYHLTTGSQAIDKGNNALAVDADGAALIYDLDGRTRIVNGTVDIGAYEYSCKVIQTSIMTAQENSPLAISEWEMFNVELRSIGDVVSTQTVSLTWNSSLFDLDTDLSVGENGVSLTFGEAVTENGITTQEVVLNVENPTILKEGALLTGLKFLPVASNSIVAGESAIWTVCVNNEALNIEVESFAFDLNDSGSVEINDLVAFARVFGQSSGESDLARIADFSGNGTVEINDLVLFARNFGKKRPSKPQAAPAPTALPAYASTPKLEEMPTVERGLVNDAAMTAYLDEME